MVILVTVARCDDVTKVVTMTDKPSTVVFFGTPAFAVPTFEALCDAPDFDVRLLVTAPDRVRGRGNALRPSDAKRSALIHRVPVAEPARPSDPQLLEQLRVIAPDFVVVVAYGGKIPSSILELPQRAIVNLHPSLLPAYRGAAPLQYALMDGLSETGITVQHLAEGWDEGDIILQVPEPILPDDNYDRLALRVAHKGAALVLTALRQLVAGTAPRLPQDHSRATFARRITPEMCRLDWERSAVQLHNLVRALSSQPGAETTLRGKQLRVLATEPVDIPSDGNPGSLRVTRKSVIVHTGKGQLALLQVQPEGRRAMDIQSFINGYHPHTGEILGASPANRQ